MTVSAISGGTKVVIRLNANGTYVVAGNSTVSNLTSNATENVTSAEITKVVFGSCEANSMWVVYRGANVTGVYSGSGTIDYPLTSDPTANITANLVGLQTGFIILEITKRSSFN